MLRLALFLLIALIPANAFAAKASPIRPVSTYSIVARDPDTGELGVAVQFRERLGHW